MRRDCEVHGERIGNKKATSSAEGALSGEKKKNMQNHDLWRTDGAEAVRVWLTGQLNSRKSLRTCQDNQSDADVMQGC